MAAVAMTEDAEVVQGIGLLGVVLEDGTVDVFGGFDMVLPQELASGVEGLGEGELDLPIGLPWFRAGCLRRVCRLVRACNCRQRQF